MKKLIVAALITVSSLAHAEFFSGNKLLQLMTSSSEVEKGIAFGYVAGTFDLGQGVVHCAPENVSLKQVSDMVKMLLENSPADRHKSADQFVIHATKTVWPCKKTSGRGTGV